MSAVQRVRYWRLRWRLAAAEKDAASMAIRTNRLTADIRRFAAELRSSE